MQAQVRMKLRRDERHKKTRGNKYNNKPTEVADIRFDSQKEARRYNELMAMLKARQIEDLRLQHTFTLQEQFKTPEGEVVRAIKYVADFTYWMDGEFIVEDVKSEATRQNKVYVIKRKLMADLGIKIREV